MSERKADVTFSEPGILDIVQQRLREEVDAVQAYAESEQMDGIRGTYTGQLFKHIRQEEQAHVNELTREMMRLLPQQYTKKEPEQPEENPAEVPEEEIPAVKTASTRTAQAWGDVVEKAYRMERQGNVHPDRVSDTEWVGDVDGSTGSYHVSLNRDMGYWQCECPWVKHTRGTSQDRMCSHVIAALINWSKSGHNNNIRLPSDPAEARNIQVDELESLL